jgi:hypothetical protein
MSCTNNLKQVGIALHNYHDTNNSLPALALPQSHGYPSMSRSFPPHDWWSVCIAILPFIEQNSYYQMCVDIQKNAAPGVAWQITETEVDAYCPILKTDKSGIVSFLCPSDSSSGKVAKNAGVGTARTSTHIIYQFKSNYLPIANGYMEICQARELNPTGWADTMPGAFLSAFCQTRFRSLVDITDGLSNTLVFSEFLRGGSEERWYGYVWDSRVGAQFLNWENTPNSKVPDRTVNSPLYCDGTNSMPEQNLPCTIAAFDGYDPMVSSRSLHPGGVNSVRGDGSVSFYTDTISVNAWRSLCAMANGGDSTDWDAEQATHPF